MAVLITGTLGVLTPTTTLGLVAGAVATGVAVIGAEAATGVTVAGEALLSLETKTTDQDHLEWEVALQDLLLEDTQVPTEEI